MKQRRWQISLLLKSMEEGEQLRSVIHDQQYQVSVIDPEITSKIKVIERSDLIIVDHILYRDWVLFRGTELRSIPVLVIVERGTIDRQWDTLQGAADILFKPFCGDELTMRIALALKRIVQNRDQYRSASYHNIFFKTLIDTIPDLVWLKDPRGGYLTCNARFERFFGAKEIEIVGKTDFDFVDEKLATFFQKNDQEAIKLGVPSMNEEEVIYADDGHREILETIKTPMFDDGGEIIGVMGIARDITERKEGEARLQQLHNYLSSIIDTMPSVLIGIDHNRRVIRWNRRAEELTGIVADDARFKPLYHLISGLKPFDEMIEECIQNGKIERIFREYAVDDGRMIHEKITILPLISELYGGAILKIEDITREQQLQEMLTHSQKMDAIGQLAGGIAHDFNNMLGGIMGAAQLLEALPIEMGEGAKYLKMIIQATGRAAELTKKLLRFSHKEKITMEVINMARVVDDAISILERTIDKSITIQLDLQAPKTTVLGNYSELQNILINLGINAAHAMSDGGIFTLSTFQQRLSRSFCEMVPFKIEPGDYLNITVNDTGSGISPENLNRIFEPFFTTKGKEKGTGLGLSAVYGIIKKHHGAITVASKPGEGTTFQIYLPLQKEAHSSREAVPKQISGRGTILLIDDEPLILMTGEEILQELGYRVLIAENGIEGVKLFQKYHHEIDCSVVDMIMPGMGGYDTIVKMRSIDPGCPVVVASGYIKDGDLDRLQQIKIQKLIKKPYRLEQLSQVINDILTG